MLPASEMTVIRDRHLLCSLRDVLRSTTSDIYHSNPIEIMCCISPAADGSLEGGSNREFVAANGCNYRVLARFDCIGLEVLLGEATVYSGGAASYCLPWATVLIPQRCFGKAACVILGARAPWGWRRGQGTIMLRRPGNPAPASW